MSSGPPRVAGLTCAVLLAAAASAAEAQQLNVICSAQAEWCNAVATEFQRETGVKVAVTLKGSGETLAQLAKQFQLPSNVTALVSPLAPKLTEVRLIDYDFARYGASAERKRLLERWDREVGSQTKRFSDRGSA